FAAVERRIDARAVVLAAREVRGGSDLAPVMAGGVHDVNQLVVLFGRAPGQIQEPPAPIEELDGETAVSRRVDGMDASRTEQPELVVPAQCLGRQPGRARERPDGHQLLVHDRHGKGCPGGKVKAATRCLTGTSSARGWWSRHGAVVAARMEIAWGQD